VISELKAWLGYGWSLGNNNAITGTCNKGNIFELITAESKPGSRSQAIWGGARTSDLEDGGPMAIE
jgi:hypothetical protein